MKKQDYIAILTELGLRLQQITFQHQSDPNPATPFKEVILKAYRANSWFTETNIVRALEQWAFALQKEKVEKWLGSYPEPVQKGLKVGVINAGNIPFVGMHDLLSVLVTGHQYLGKNAGDDPYLLPFIAGIFSEIRPSLSGRIQFLPQLKGIEAVIATGSNNSARYFEYYFGKYPNIIRKNRNGVAVLNGNETKDQLELLGKDIFTYFGLGCRNVSKLYVPGDYRFDPFFEAIYSFNDIMNHNHYMNNFEYNNSVLLLKRVPFLQNGFLIIMEDPRIASPISILHYERYNSLSELEKHLTDSKENLQCIVAAEDTLNDKDLKSNRIDFGMTQSPELWNYADGVDTVQWLHGIRM
jgi:hypothetical protein